jgi:hypothetical protein
MAQEFRDLWKMTNLGRGRVAFPKAKSVSVDPHSQGHFFLQKPHLQPLFSDVVAQSF